MLCSAQSGIKATNDTDAASRIQNRLAEYFVKYTNTAFNSDTPIRLTKVSVDQGQRVITILANAAFAEQPFTRETARRIHQDIKQLLPQPYNTFRLIVLANGTPIEELIPMAWNDTVVENRTWYNCEYKGYPWVTPTSLPVNISQGLAGRHISLWASHGRYFDFNEGTWQWQRPNLYCTNEDLFTQSIVVPFLIPMLENAGAIVFTPRERDWQREEVIVDNDTEGKHGIYTEKNGILGWATGEGGFSHTKETYYDKENTFAMGTYRYSDVQPRKRQCSQILWQPQINVAGEHAVYVSYVTLPNSVCDAEYAVIHRGITTKFRVNQQMGGGTWVYLGTFDFGRGCSPDNCVMLTNVSNYRGVITADAVRFGGGMGNVMRGDSIHAYTTSGLPRFLEGSRYTTQWSGMPYEVYGNKEGTNDYGEDINARSLMTNRLARGSIFLPGDSGLNVPLELSLAIHSDAGYRQDSSYIGTLGIYTSGLYTSAEFEGMLAEGILPSKKSRLMSRDLCDMVMTQVVSDIEKICGKWNRRQIYDRNYSETRVPEVPSMILETLSHQNFADLMLGHDPTFKMYLSRAIYKGVLRFIATAHQQKELVVQPLPVKNFSALLNEQGDSVCLSWEESQDLTEPSSRPDTYVIYTSVGEKGYDNGQVVYSHQATLPVTRGELTRYIVKAANVGGTSLPSEELCIYTSKQEKHRILIVNGFHRLASPQPIDDNSRRGFDMNIDPGVVYKYSPCFCGKQINFSKTGFGYSKEAEIGYSGNELEGMIVAGNTFDYPTQHAQDILTLDSTLSISSCSKESLERGLTTATYKIIDLIFGAERNDGYSMKVQGIFNNKLYKLLSDYSSAGGNLLISGAYIAEEIDPSFARNTLHLIPGSPYFINEQTCQLTGLNTSFSIYNEPNENRYAVKRLSMMVPTEDSFTSVTNINRNASLAVAYQSPSYNALTYGFPLECIREAETRRNILYASLQFLLQK